MKYTVNKIYIKNIINPHNWLNRLEWVLENKNHGGNLVSYITHRIHNLL